VPHDLQLDGFAVELNGAYFKINADRTYIRLGVCVVSEPEKQTRLSDSTVANKEQFEQVVILRVHDSGCKEVQWELHK